MNLAEHLPAWMHREGPFGLAVWQWIGIPMAILVGWFVGQLLTWLLIKIVRRLTAHTTTTFDDQLVDRLGTPLRAAATILLVRAQLPLLALSPTAEVRAHDILLGSFAFVLVWGALRAIDLSTTRLTTASWAQQRPASRALLVLLGRIGKVLVIIIAGIGFLGGLGLPVASLLAGLGIGGIALAFGAQKTVENLFGAVALGVDQPLREGDFVRLEGDVMGTVEMVGLRSTRLRTLDRTLVTLPNGRLSDMRIETFAARDRCRLHTMINVTYSTTAEQLRQILAGFERVLKEHPHIWPDDMVVRFTAFGNSSLDIEVMAWFKTGDFPTFRKWREDVLIQFMEIVERAGSAFAFPTRTLHIAADAREARRAS